MTDGTGIFYSNIVCTLHLTINDVNVVSNNEDYCVGDALLLCK